MKSYDETPWWCQLPWPWSGPPWYAQIEDPDAWLAAIRRQFARQAGELAGDLDLVRAAARLISLPGDGAGFYLAWTSPGAWAPMIACQAQVVGADCLTRYAEGQSQDHRRHIRSRSEDHARTMAAVCAGAVGLAGPGESGDG